MASAKCSETPYGVAAASQAGSAPGMGTEELGPGTAQGKGRKEPFSDFSELPALAATMACGVDVSCDSPKRPHWGYPAGRDRVAGG